MRAHPVIVLATLTVFFWSSPAPSYWQEDGVPVCTATNDQTKPEAVTDSDGGSIIVWCDNRSGTGQDIYVQRILKTGLPAWPADGVAICTASGDQTEPRITATRIGETIITWWDKRNVSGPGGLDGDIYAQKIDASGNVQWETNGVPVCSLSTVQFLPEIASDGSGGAVITWTDERNGNRDIYAQRLTKGGTAKWTSQGMPVCANLSGQTLPGIANDDGGNTVISWMDFRNSGDRDIYAQILDINGNIGWATNGEPVIEGAGEQWYPKMIFDGHNGVMFSWYDTRNGSTNLDIYAQRLKTGDGSYLWPSSGVAVCQESRNQRDVQMVPDGSFGAILSWEDSRNTLTGVDIYAQRIDMNGDTLWTADGIPVTNANNDQDTHRMAADGNGGAYIVWVDDRGFTMDNGIYVQRLDENGDPLYQVDGEVVATSYPTWWPVVVVDPDGDAVVSWQDQRSGEKDIYAQCLDLSTVSVERQPPGLADISLYQNVPNPFSGMTRIAFDAPASGSAVHLGIHDVAGRLVRMLVNGEVLTGSHTVQWDGRNTSGSRLSPGVYFVRLAVLGEVQTRAVVLTH